MPRCAPECPTMPANARKLLQANPFGRAPLEDNERTCRDSEAPPPSVRNSTEPGQDRLKRCKLAGDAGESALIPDAVNRPCTVGEQLYEPLTDRGILDHGRL